MVAISKNGIIGNGSDIPWAVKGEQLLFKAMTYNQWLLVGRKTFQSMGVLPNRKYAVLSRSDFKPHHKPVLVYPSFDEALADLPNYTKHVIVSGGGEVYKSTIDVAGTLHISVIDQEVEGDIQFPRIPKEFHIVFEQEFESNINYTYQIWQKY
jgi:dihydrofolate reductase (trimethoprim resistance protein)